MLWSAGSASAVSIRRASSSFVVANAVTASSAPDSPHPATYGTVDPKPDARARQMCGGVDDHLGPLATVLGVSDSERVDRLVDQDPQPSVRGLIGVDDDPAGVLIAPPARRARDRLERYGEPERLGERPRRHQQMRV